MMPSREREPSELETIIGYEFNDDELLKSSLKHKSALEGKDGACNDKLEWLGDRVVGLFVADYLFHHYDRPRSWLSSTQSKWVSEECLAQVARRINLERFIVLGRGEEKSGGSTKDSILAATLEALIGAVFLDSGSFSLTRNVLLKIFFSGGGMDSTFLSVNYKGLFQRWCLKSCECLPSYVVLETSLSGRTPHYRVAAQINGSVIATGEGKNKKRAEQRAAEAALEKLSGKTCLLDIDQCD